MNRYTAILGPNTKQWWAYDEETGDMIDPPSDVLEQIEDYSDDVDEQEEYFNSILETEPEWLEDTDHRYTDGEFDI